MEGTIENEELYEHFRFLVDPKQSPIRIDKWLMDKMEKISRNKIQQAAKEGYIFVNGETVKSSYKVNPGDDITIALPYEKKKVVDIIAEDIPLDIIYEDQAVIVLNKPPGLVVHPGIGNHSGTLVNALAFHLKSAKLPIKKSNTSDRPGIVHRIDKDTSGLMVVAKTEHAMTHLAKQFFDHTIEREYNALVWGNFDEPKGTVVGHVGRHKTNRLRMDVYPDGDQGKHAVTHYEVIEDLYYVSLVKCVLETGRTHQIRVHMKHLGHPLFSDQRYDGNKIWKGTVYSKYKTFVKNSFKFIRRQALHAKVLGFTHPETEERMRFVQELPADIEKVLDRWRGYLASRKDN